MVQITKKELQEHFDKLRAQQKGIARKLEVHDDQALFDFVSKEGERRRLVNQYRANSAAR